MKQFAALTCVVFLLCASAYAQSSSNAASKATAASSGATVLFPASFRGAASSAFAASTAFAAVPPGFTSNSSSASFDSNAQTNTQVLATPWIPVLTTAFKPPGGKDLFITFSGVTGIFTAAVNTEQNNAFVASSGFANSGLFSSASSSGSGFATTGAGAASSANLRIELRALVDGNVAEPGVITLDNLMRNLGRFRGLVFSDACGRDISGGAFVSVSSSCSSSISDTDLLSLVLEEGGARSFTFIKRNVGVGIHTITIQARFAGNNLASTSASAGEVATASAFRSSFTSSAGSSTTAGATALAVAQSQISAMIGKRDVTVEEVNLR